MYIYRMEVCTVATEHVPSHLRPLVVLQASKWRSSEYLKTPIFNLSFAPSIPAFIINPCCWLDVLQAQRLNT
jgi:hypothetical protein